jgi:hypothetical protein
MFGVLGTFQRCLTDEARAQVIADFLAPASELRISCAVPQPAQGATAP